MKYILQGMVGAVAILFFMAPTSASQALKDTVATVSLEAKKLDPATHSQVWSIITNHLPSLAPLFGRQVHLSSNIIRSSAKGILVFKNQPTYFFIYKNNKASEEPVMSVITPEDIEETGPNPILVLDTYGSVIVTSQKEYEDMLKAKQIAFSPVDQETMVEKKSSLYHTPGKVAEKVSTQVEQPFIPFVPEAPALTPEQPKLRPAKPIELKKDEPEFVPFVPEAPALIPASTPSAPEAPRFDLDMTKIQAVKPTAPKKGEPAFVPFVPEAPAFTPEQPKPSKPVTPGPTATPDKQKHLTAIEQGFKLKPINPAEINKPETSKSALELKLEKIREATQDEEQEDYSKEDWD